MKNKAIPLRVRLTALPLIFLAITLHFYLAACFVHWLGDPLHSINSLGPIRNPLLYRPAQIVFWLYELCWIALLVVFYLILRFLVLKTVRIICGEEAKAEGENDPVKRAFAWLTPVLIVSMTTLLLVPFNSYKSTATESVMAVGTQMSLGDFIVYITNASFVVVIALGLVLFTILFIGVFSRSPKAGVGSMFLGIFLGIITAVALGFCLAPGIEWLHAHFGGTSAFFLLFFFYSVVSAAGMWLASSPSKDAFEK